MDVNNDVLKVKKAMEDLHDVLGDILGRKHEKGNWILYSDSKDHVANLRKCSRCNNVVFSLFSAYDRWNFCPNCGADMRGEQDE